MTTTIYILETDVVQTVKKKLDFLAQEPADLYVTPFVGME